MKREIKFRAWNTRDERIDIAPYHFDFDSDKNCRAYEDWRDLEDGRSYPCILMQYTGLKDKNGKEIYEGDIILFDEGGNEVIDQMVWDNTFQFHSKNNCDNSQSDFDENGAEIIGNIYENPELLK